MRVHLARHVSRRAAARGAPLPGRPVRYAALPGTASPSIRTYSVSSVPCWRCRPIAPPLAPSATGARRTFFGIFKRAPRQIKRPELEPGWATISIWRARIDEDLRPPSRKELVAAFQDLFVYKLQFNVAVNSTQAQRCNELLEYLLENKAGESEEGLTLVQLTAARDALLQVPKEKTDAHLAFTIALFNEIKEQRESDEGGRAVAAKETPGKGADDHARDDFRSYISALTQYGGSTKAAAVLETRCRELADAKGEIKAITWLWVKVLRGLAQEGNETELLRVLEVAEAAGLAYMPPVHEVFTSFYASRDRVAETKTWFEKPIFENQRATAEAYRQVMRFALRTKQQAWSTKVFQELCDANPTKDRWDAIFEWAVLAMGKGVEDVRHMIEVMVRLGRGGDGSGGKEHVNLPNIQTINGLISAAMERRDPYMAERFLALGVELGIQPNSTTYLLQIDYRLKAKDLSGAAAAYHSLQSTPIHHDEDLPVVNRYLRALAAAKKPDFARISNLLAELEERVVTLEPETVATLALAFLTHDRQFDAIDVLSAHNFQFSLSERAVVRDGLVAYCLDTTRSTARVWDAYQLLRQYFQETSVDDRVRLMDAFFARRRPDMATHVFGHMRQHGDSALRPTLDIYIRCLELLGKYPDKEGLHIVHNMMKMDTTIQPDTRLFNALMYAYGADGDYIRAADYWAQIAHSPEGPSYASIEIAFWVCERQPFGDKVAKSIWEKLKRMDIDVPVSVATAYVGAVAGNGDVGATKKFLTGMVEDLGYGPEPQTLGVAYNAIPSQLRQEEFKTWAKTRFPIQWANLEKLKFRKDANGLGKFRIERHFQA